MFWGAENWRQMRLVEKLKVRNMDFYFKNCVIWIDIKLGPSNYFVRDLSSTSDNSIRKICS